MAALFSLGNVSLQQQAKTYFEKQLRDGCRGVCPGAALLEGNGPSIPIAASDLELATSKHHFEAFEPTADNNQWVTEALEDIFETSRDEGERQFMRPIALCSGHMMARAATLLGSEDLPYAPWVNSEAELRFTFLDPLLDMLSNCWGYQVSKVSFSNAMLHLHQQVRLEEKVSSSLPKFSQEAAASPPRPQTRSQQPPPPGTPGTKAVRSVSDKSRVDVCVHVLKNKLQSVVALIMECKLCSHAKFAHAVAQVSLKRSVFRVGAGLAPSPHAAHWLLCKTSNR